MPCRRSMARMSARASLEKITRLAIPKPGLTAWRPGHFPEVVHRQTEIGQDLFDRRPASSFERGDTRLNRGPVFRRDRFIVNGSQRQLAVERREHGFKEAIQR